MFVSADHKTMFAAIYPAGESTFTTVLPIEETRAAIAANAPPGVTTHLTGVDAIFQSQGGSSRAERARRDAARRRRRAAHPALRLRHAAGRADAAPRRGLLDPDDVPLRLGLTYVTDVSIIVQFLVALVGLGIAIDYSLLMIFRFREEIANGRTTDDAIVETMQHAGRSVIVSGSTVAIGLVSMVILPLPFIRSIGLGGMLIPLVSVLASITLTPALLRILGPKINRVRVMPKRLLTPDDVESGFWMRWARHRSRGGRSSIFLLGMVVVVLLLIPASKINPSDAETARQPAAADAAAGRQALAAAGITQGVFKPFAVLVEGTSDPAKLDAIAAAVRATRRDRGRDGADGRRAGAAATRRCSRRSRRPMRRRRRAAR